MATNIALCVHGLYITKNCKIGAILNIKLEVKNELIANTKDMKSKRRLQRNKISLVMHVTS